MSADNYTTCPRCRDKRLQFIKSEIIRVNGLYGKISAAEYVDEAARLQKTEKDINPTGNTLREDYEFYMALDGTFTVSYRAGCSECAFSHTFNHSEKVNI